MKKGKVSYLMSERMKLVPLIPSEQFEKVLRKVLSYKTNFH